MMTSRDRLASHMQHAHDVAMAWDYSKTVLSKLHGETGCAWRTNPRVHSRQSKGSVRQLKWARGLVNAIRKAEA